jgi:hypothetical protein
MVSVSYVMKGGKVLQVVSKPRARRFLCACGCRTAEPSGTCLACQGVRPGDVRGADALRDRHPARGRGAAGRKGRYFGPARDDMRAGAED